MTEPATDRHLPAADIEEMVRLVRPDWTVASASLVEDGASAIYRLSRPSASGLDPEAVHQLGLTVFSMVSLEDDDLRSRSPSPDRTDEAAAGLRTVAHQLLGGSAEPS